MVDLSPRLNCKLNRRFKGRLKLWSLLPFSFLLALLALVGTAATPVQAQGCVFPITVSDEAQLHEAIHCYNSQTTPGEYVLTLGADIVLSTSTPGIVNATSGVSLRVAGDGHTVDGQGSLGVRPFTIESSADVTIEQTTIARGRAYEGGGIQNKGTLTVNNSLITGNQSDHPFEDGRGGGIYNWGRLTVINSTFTDNFVFNSGVLPVGGGGAIFNDEDGQLLVFNSTFHNNRVDGFLGPGGGGAITNYSDGLAPSTHRGLGMKIFNSTFTNNSAKSNGGAIFNVYGAGIIFNSTFYGNSSDGGGVIVNSQINKSFLGIFNSIIAGTPSGGACVGERPWVFGGSNWIDDAVNSCGLDGVIGQPIQLGLLQDNGGLTWTHALLEGSPAINRGVDMAMGFADITCAGNLGNAPDVTWEYCDENAAMVTPNITTDQRGEGFARVANGLIDIGAYEAQIPCSASPIAVDSVETLNAAIGCFNQETTPGEYGIILTTNINLSAHTAYFRRGDWAIPVATIPFDNPNAGVSARLDGGGYTVDGQGIEEMHPFDILDNTTVTLQNITLTGGRRSSWSDGGTVVNFGTLTVLDSTISHGEGSRGGGIYNYPGATLYVINSTISHSRNTIYGGSIYNDDGMVTIHNSTISEEGTLYGALWSNRALTVTNSIISGNIGGIYNTGSLMVANTTFISNSHGIENYGGAATVRDSIFKLNMGVTGSAIENQSGTLALLNSTIHDNTTGAGAIANYPQGTLSIINSTISGNHATNTESAGIGGGGIAIFGGAVSILNSTISDNSSANGPESGGGIWHGGGTLTLGNTILANNVNGDCAGSATDLGNNLTTSTLACGLSHSVNGNIIGQDAKLGPLQENGGPTLTHVLLPGSPALNAGNNAIARDPQNQPLVTDQRGEGFARVINDVVDIGAYEEQIPCAFPAQVGNEAALARAILCYNAQVTPGEYLITLSGDVALSASTRLIANTSADVSLRIDGAGYTVDGQAVPGMKVFSIDAGTTVIIEKTTITGGNAAIGGGIINRGTLTVRQSTFSGNHASRGGGIDNWGTLTVRQSTFSGNSAVGAGGGINNEIGSVLTVINSTFSGNHADIGGGINSESGSVLTVLNSTFNGNNIEGISNQGTLTLGNTIFVNNIHADCAGTATDLGHNLIAGPQSCGLSHGVNGNIIGQDPMLGLLQDNGGPTWTHALLEGSPAIDAGNSVVCADLATVNNLDQRGVARPQRIACDIGAFEVEPLPDSTPPDTAITTGPADPSASPDASFVFTGTDDLTLVENLRFECSLDGGDFGPCTSPHSYNALADGSHTFAVRAIDEAGHVDETPASYNWNINTTPPDNTPPTASPVQEPVANANGWNNGNVTVTWNWMDDGAGIDPANCPSSSTSSGEGELPLSATCADLAGNQGNASYTVRVDQTPPTINAAAASAPNASGWYTSDVTVQFNCADALSGIADGGCPASQPLTDEGTAVASTEQTVIDNAGNISAPSNVVTVQIDKSPPVVTVTGVSEGAIYELGSVLPASCDTQDAVSGVAQAATVAISGGNGDGSGNFTATCAAAQDNAGHDALPVSVNYSVEAQSCTLPATVGDEAQLGAAIACFNGQTTAGEYVITLSGDISLTASTPAIQNATTGASLYLDGGGHTIDGQELEAVRPFTIDANTHVTLHAMTITRGRGPGTGGAIFNQGTLTLTYSSVRNSHAGSGGGLANFGALTILHSDVSHNHAASGSGGGIFNNNGAVTIINSTVADNSAPGDFGGGLYNDFGTMTVTNSTLSHNRAESGGGLFTTGVVTLTNTIIANSTGGACQRNDGTVNASHSLIDEGLVCVNGTNANNLTGDPNLGDLQNNGGATLTYALLPGSSAREAGDSAAALDAQGQPLVTDQRGEGFSRVLGSVVDIGAFEAEPEPMNVETLNVVVLGQVGVKLDQRVTVHSGAVVVNSASEGPFLDSSGVELSIGQQVTFQGDSSAYADSVKVNQRSVIPSLHYNHLVEGQQVTINQRVTPLALPMVELPPFLSSSPSGNHVTVAQAKSLTLAAGSYGDFKVNQRATVIFTGGEYHFASWDVGQQVNLYFAAPSEVRIAGRLAVGQRSVVAPQPGAADLSAHDIVIYVAGLNGNNGGLSGSPKTAQIGQQVELQANIYAPNGTVLLNQRTNVRGAVIGHWVEIGQQVNLTLDPALTTPVIVHSDDSGGAISSTPPQPGDESAEEPTSKDETPAEKGTDLEEAPEITDRLFLPLAAR